MTTLEGGGAGRQSSEPPVGAVRGQPLRRPAALLSRPEDRGRGGRVARLASGSGSAAYYQDPSNFFAQFAVDPDVMLDMYPEFDGSSRARARRFLATAHRLHDRRGARGPLRLEGRVTRVPLLGAIFPHPDGADVAWEFEVERDLHARPKRNFDPNTLLFHWDYFEETIEASAETGLPGRRRPTSCADRPRDATRRRRDGAVDGLFENGPQRVQTTSESGVPARSSSRCSGTSRSSVGAIGGGVLARHPAGLRD